MTDWLLSLFRQDRLPAWFDDFPPLNMHYLGRSNAWGEPRSALR